VIGSKLPGFGGHKQTTANKRTKRGKFLAKMNPLVTLKALIALIEPQYPKTGSKGGRPFYPLAI
jgi:transposase, IS5 family